VLLDECVTLQDGSRQCCVVGKIQCCEEAGRQAGSDPPMPASFPFFLSFFLSFFLPFFFASIGLIFEMLRMERFILSVCLSVCCRMNARKLFYSYLFVNGKGIFKVCHLNFCPQSRRVSCCMYRLAYIHFYSIHQIRILFSYSTQVMFQGVQRLREYGKLCACVHIYVCVFVCLFVLLIEDIEVQI